MNLLIKLANDHDTNLAQIANRLEISRYKLYKENKKDLNEIKIKVIDDFAIAFDSTPQEILLELMELEDEIK